MNHLSPNGTQPILQHYWRSSCSWRVRWALAIKEVPYISQPTNLLEREHETPSYLTNTPIGLVPTLTIDDQSYSQSLAIIEYLEERFPTPPLLPSSPENRMRVRQLAYLIACDTQPLQNLGPQRYHSDDPEIRLTYARHWIMRGLDAYEKTIAKGMAGDFSFGSTVTLADLCLIPQVYNALRFKVDMAQYPTVQRIYDRCLTLKECDTAAPHNQPGAPG